MEDLEGRVIAIETDAKNCRQQQAERMANIDKRLSNLEAKFWAIILLIIAANGATIGTIIALMKGGG